MLRDMSDDHTPSRYTVGGLENEYMDHEQKVLKNKKGIADLQTLYIEEEKTLGKAYEILLNEVRSDTPITSELILYVHRTVFVDLYEWAGQWRTVTISKPGVTWPPPDFLHEAMQSFQNEVLNRYPATSLKNDDVFCRALGHIQGEFLAIHPFREGNARTIKLVTDLLGAQTNRPLLIYNDSDAGKSRYINAAKAALVQDFDPMTLVIKDALTAARRS